MSSFLLAPIAILLVLSTCFISEAKNESRTLETLPVASCGAFIQGIDPLPVESCYQNLSNTYNNQPGCLCLWLNETRLSEFPLNVTRALQLPKKCNIPMDVSDCKGTTLSSPTAPQVPSTPPKVPSTPRLNSGMKLNAQGRFVMLLLMAYVSRL